MKYHYNLQDFVQNCLPDALIVLSKYCRVFDMVTLFIFQHSVLSTRCTYRQ